MTLMRKSGRFPPSGCPRLGRGDLALAGNPAEALIRRHQIDAHPGELRQRNVIAPRKRVSRQYDAEIAVARRIDRRLGPVGKIAAGNDQGRDAEAAKMTLKLGPVESAP